MLMMLIQSFCSMVSSVYQLLGRYMGIRHFSMFLQIKATMFGLVTTEVMFMVAKIRHSTQMMIAKAMTRIGLNSSTTASMKTAGMT